MVAAHVYSTMHVTGEPCALMTRSAPLDDRAKHDLCVSSCGALTPAVHASSAMGWGAQLQHLSAASFRDFSAVQGRRLFHHLRGARAKHGKLVLFSMRWPGSSRSIFVRRPLRID